MTFMQSTAVAWAAGDIPDASIAVLETAIFPDAGG
jgi:hypothetical protein